MPQNTVNKKWNFKRFIGRKVEFKTFNISGYYEEDRMLYYSYCATVIELLGDYSENEWGEVSQPVKIEAVNEIGEKFLIQGELYKGGGYKTLSQLQLLFAFDDGCVNQTTGKQTKLSCNLKL